jgi:hypothetical protein
LAEALEDRLLAAELERRFAQERTRGPSQLERYAAELKQRAQEQAQKQEHALEQPGEKGREQGQEQKKEKKQEQKEKQKAPFKGRQREIEKDWEPER